VWKIPQVARKKSVNVKCFECGALIEGNDSDEVVLLFVAHGRKSHSWSYPKEAIRNYARNYADAIERLTGSTERLSAIPDITVHPVTEERVDDWLRFFDHDAFAGNPDWPHAIASNLTYRTRRRILNVHGGTHEWPYAAGFAAERPPGISHTSPTNARGGSTPHFVPTIGVSCFIIAPPFRRHGVAAALLDRVIEDASARGASWIEAYPHNEPKPNDAAHFRGPRSMYAARGFQPVEVREDYTVMRRRAVSG
jgi:GNAT superfamily N-acetyltransferase